MKALTAIAIVLTATPAFADPGHVAEQGGHSHWLAAGAFAAAAFFATALWRSRRKETERKV